MKMRIQTETPWLADGYRFKLFEDETLKDAALKPSDKDPFILHPHDQVETYVEYSVGAERTDVTSPNVPAAPQRIKSASSVRLQDRPWRKTPTPKYPNGFVPRSRPSSAVPTKTRPLSGSIPANRRIRSAGSTRTRAETRAQETIDELRKGFSLVNKLYENDYRGQNISLHPASPAPDYRYFDRHSRCYNHTHAHHQTLSDRPQRACEKFLEACGSRANSPALRENPYGQPQRYIDYHRPKTAPGTRRELQYIPRASYVYRGHVPHFCNFVQPLALHTKSSGSHGDGSLSGVPQEDDEEEDEELKYITETADARLINKWRKDSNSSSRDRDRTPVPPLDEYLDESTKSNSGTEGRPGSPNSQDGADGQTNGNEPVMGIVNVTVASPRRSEPSGTKSKIHSSDVSKDIEILDSYVGTSMPVVPEETQSSSDRPSSSAISDTKRKGADSLLILTNVDRDLDSTSNGHLSNGRPPSPHRPPPSPEPQKLPVTKASEPPTTGRKRGCINKKVKKPIERTRKTKATESSSPEPVLLESEKMESLATPTTDSEKAEGKVELQVPDLPSGVEEKKSKKKEKSKPKRHLIEAEDDLFKQDATDVLNDQLKQNRVDIDFSNMDTNGADDLKRPPQIKSWIQGRLALSQQSSRFELPMDMKNLETMTPEEYIRKHCIITSRRQNLYSKIFLKNKDKTHCIPYKELDRSLKDVLVHTITSEQVQSVLDTFGITENTKVDFKYFAGMAAFAERILYPKYVTEDTVDMPEYQREKIECADFCALDWKFHGIKINPKMLHLLNQLR